MVISSKSKAKEARIVMLPGDNIGPEVTREAARVLEAVTSLRSKKHGVSVKCVEALIGGAAIDATDETLSAIDHPDTCAVFLGAVGGPQWDKAAKRPEQGLLQLRKHLNCYANLRPCFFPSASLVSESPLKESIAKDVDFIIVRELCGGIYFGEKKESDGGDVAWDKEVYSTGEIERIARVSGELARVYATTHGTKPKVASIDKANVLASSRHWRKVVTTVMEKEFPEVELSHYYVDAAAMHLIKTPSMFNGVVVTSNIFGDILSDESSVIVGSLGLLPSASLCGWPGELKASSAALYEPIHGSAPDIAGKGVANPVGAILSMAMLVRYSLGWEAEAKAIEDAVRTTLDTPHMGGFGFRTADLGGKCGTRKFADKVCELLRESLGLLSSKDFDASLDKAQTSVIPAQVPVAAGRRPMNICEKIIFHHAEGVSSRGIKPGDTVCVKVDWTLASELTWKGMEKTYNEIGRPSIWRNDRFWLAIDHTVDPSINDQPKPRELIRASTEFAKEASIKDFYGPNQTILHTDFYRERAQPGQVVIGADSHSCSAGGLGAFAVGLGAADVVMPLVTGRTWFKVPETVKIEFVGKPPRGIGGKDAILWILGELKRNTVAFERAVEFTGEGIKHLSCDARFAISNMATEFGGIAGVFDADEQTAAYISRRRSPEYKSDAIYFRADPDAQYAESHLIDLTRVDSMVALYPSPDHVVPVDEVEGMKLDGIFIGACTTAEEDLVIGALVLEAGLKEGLIPSISGKRKVTPGSVSILTRLKQFGLIEVYEKAGFEIGAPGCSYCLGIAADRAGEGEVWLSSQNRNFKNRMGKGSFGNIASAATCAASSFDMKIKNPRDLLDKVDWVKFEKLVGVKEEELKKVHVNIIEPTPSAEVSFDEQLPSPPEEIKSVISGRVQKFGDHVDTDAIIPAEFMPGENDQDLGTHCFQYVRPGFRQLVQEGYTIVVAGSGFGSGSSREEAPRALKGCGVQAVIAKSYAFIYGRNQANMALLGIIPHDFDNFYALVQEGSLVRINVTEKKIHVVDENDDIKQSFTFDLSMMEERLISGGGVTDLYKNYGKSLFQVVMQGSGDVTPNATSSESLPKMQELATKSPLKSKPIEKQNNCGCGTSAEEW